MRICVSTIMKDEPVEFIERWVESAREADELLLVDTGTTKTDAINRALDLGVRVERITVDPWRFDVARNLALGYVGESVDTVVKLDVDEVLSPGWRAALEEVGPALRYAYRYVWSHHDDGCPDVEFNADHTISRHGWAWKHPVHEALYFADGTVPDAVFVPGMTIEHFADPTKPRTDYLPLLEMATAEDPEDDRMSHYYGRELYYRGDWVAARAELMRHLSLPSAKWPAERAQSYRLIAKMDYHPERWLLRAAAEDPDRREPWVDLAGFYTAVDQPDLAAAMARRALLISRRSNDYMTESAAWDDEALLRMIGD